MMTRLKSFLIWLRRLFHCRGFGIQSPSDYWFVRYVINEHWPYYQYSEVGKGDEWLTRKLGRLCFRLANWKQPEVVTSQSYREYLQAGCHSARFGENGQLIVVSETDDVTRLMDTTDERTVLLMEHIQRRKRDWQRIIDDPRTTTIFDLYYCGIAMFDKRRAKKHYIINF